MKKLAFAAAIFVGWIAHGQNDWNQIPVNTMQKLNSIDFVNNQVGFIGGDSLTLLKTTDGGLTWNEMDTTGIGFFVGSEHVLDVDFVSENVGYIVIGPYGDFYRTTDGGTSWNPVAPGTGQCYKGAVYAFDDQNAFVGGAGCFNGEEIMRLQNGSMAQVFMVPSSSSSGLITAFDFYRSTKGIAVSSGGLIMMTDDGGATWDTTSAAAYLGGLTDVFFLEDSIIYATYVDVQGGGFGVAISTDNGVTWAPDNNAATFFYPNMHAAYKAAADRYVFAGEIGWDASGLIMEWKPHLNYYSMYSSPQEIYDVTGYADSTYFVVGDSGYVATNVDPASLSVTETHQRLEVTVYPNPADDVVNIVADASHGPLEIRVFDMTGREVMHVQSYQSNSGMNVERLRSGTYVIVISTGNKRSQQLLVKQ